MDVKLALLFVVLLTLVAQHVQADYIWHNDEIPYNPKATCRRGHSYYSNSHKAKDTDIDVGSDIESLLDYSDHDVCFYCVCSVHGDGTDCITRNPWYCNYYRMLRDRDAARDMYRDLLQQDRPTYFRQLSYRLRRTMDTGMFDLMDNVGSGNGIDNKKCVPLISEYTDCTEANICEGCSKCSCTADGEWSCEKVHQCPGDDLEPSDDGGVEEEDIDNALDHFKIAIINHEQKEKSMSKYPLVPQPSKPTEELVLEEKPNIEDEILALMRHKRSVDERNHVNAKNNSDIKFYDTVDEINEDILKKYNESGTIRANKFKSTPHVLRRTGALNKDNSTVNDLQIEYTQSKIYNHNIADNKIDTTANNEDKFDLLSREKIYNIIGNHTPQIKDHDITKLVVNELKNGTEIIGNGEAPIMSNITFTPENDTLTAMAFIAGNLLNKLWNMEKDTSDHSIESEVLKHEKIADLLDLFKEPLNLRQETFLKNALEQLSDAIDNNKYVRNVSLCENVEELKKIFVDTNTSNNDNTEVKENSRHENDTNGKKNNQEKETRKTAAKEAITKINTVLDLIQKYEHVQNDLQDLKYKSKIDLKQVGKENSTSSVDKTLTEEEKKSINLFGNIFETITKLLVPNKNAKKLINSMRTKNIFGNGQNVRTKLKNLYNTDIGNLTVATKDKIILDYLTHIEKSPDCLLNEKSEKLDTKRFPSVEGNILLNLSEFFKIKSFIDLMNLVHPDVKQNYRTSMTTSDTPLETSTANDVNQSVTKNDEPKKLAGTKERLKVHLKAILEDLIQIQNAKGTPANEANINIADALPCIYKILNTDKEMRNKTNKNVNRNALDTVTEIFDSLKKNLKVTSLTRRSNVVGGQRPKSAVVWERVIKSLDGKQKKTTRRTINTNIPKSMNELNKMMENLQLSTSDSYKTKALQFTVPPADRLLLLKVLEMEAKKYVKTLENIKLALESVRKLPAQTHNHINEFVENAATNTKLNEKVLKHLEKSNTKTLFEEQIDTKMESLKSIIKLDESARFQAPSLKNMKLTRDQIINHVIKNRLQQYKKVKEAKQINLENDMQYNIANNILLYLERGNYSLARELYKVFASQKQNRLVAPESFNVNKNKRIRTVLGNKEPLIQFSDPKLIDNQMQWTSTDQLVKQLLNITKMKVQ